MSNIQNHETAKIYQFPVGGRNAASRRFEDSRLAIDSRMSSAIAAALGSSSFHEAAMLETDTNRKS